MISFKVDKLAEMNDSLKEFIKYLESLDVNDDALFDSRLVCCELISNVIKHCHETAYFKGAVVGDEIVIGVSSDSSFDGEAKPKLPDVLSECGRGLYIVNAVSGGNVRFEGSKIIVKLKLGEQQ